MGSKTLGIRVKLMFILELEYSSTKKNFSFTNPTEDEEKKNKKKKGNNRRSAKQAQCVPLCKETDGTNEPWFTTPYVPLAKPNNVRNKQHVTYIHMKKKRKSTIYEPTNFYLGGYHENLVRSVFPVLGVLKHARVRR